MRKCYLILLSILSLFLGCSPKAPRNIGDLPAIQGCWKGGQVSRVNRPPSELRLFSLRPDSSLALSLIYEIGPRSRVRTPDIDVSVEEGRISWDDSHGYLNESKDTLTVVGDPGGDGSRWEFVREKSADSLMRALLLVADDEYVYSPPETRDDGWACADMTSTGIDKTRIIGLVQRIRRGKHGDIHSFLIAKENQLVVEEYFADNGTRHGPLITGIFRDQVHHLASTTKCVTSTLVGIAIDRGFISSVDEPICTYLPAYASLFNQDKKRITISHMLTMTPGFEWRQFGVSDDRNDGMQMWNTNDVIRFVLQKPLETQPGEQFNYTNGVPTVTGAVIKNAVGTEVCEFAERYLFSPLGITEYVWTSYPDGSLETDGGLALRARDLAKLGQLFLNKGVWNGKRIVSEQWIHEATRERLKFGGSLRWGYGFHWMQAETNIGNHDIHFIFVPGDGNQILAVFPTLQMVVVFTAGNYGLDPKKVYNSLFEDQILPAVVYD